jgi:hypothetical protein
MVQIEAWDEFARQAESLFQAEPEKVRAFIVGLFTQRQGHSMFRAPFVGHIDALFFDAAGGIDLLANDASCSRISEVCPTHLSIKEWKQKLQPRNLRS